MIYRETMHHILQDIADYFRACRKNAAPGSAAEVRFERYVSAVTEADKRLKEMERYDGSGNRARN